MKATTRQRLHALAQFLPAFEAPGFVFGTWNDGTKEKSGAITLPDFTFSPTTEALHQAIYKNGWVMRFDWAKWMETAEARALYADQDAIARATPEQLAMLLTALVRSERSCDGAMAGAHETGLWVRILRRAASLEHEGAETPLFWGSGAAAHRERGLELWNSGRRSEAAKELRGALSLDPLLDDAGRLWGMLARQSSAERNYGTASGDFANALQREAEPEVSCELLSDLASVLDAAGRRSEAVPVLEELARQRRVLGDVVGADNAQRRARAARDAPWRSGPLVVALDSQRQIAVTEVQMWRTWRGMLVGGPDGHVSARLLQKLEQDVRRRFPERRWAFQVVPWPDQIFPAWTLVAECFCGRAVRTEDSDYASALLVGWFAESVSGPLIDIVHGGMGSIDWNRHATDYDFTFV